MNTLLLILITLAGAAGVLYGLFLFIARPGRRKKGIYIAAATVVLFFAATILLMNQDMRAQGWNSASDHSDAQKEGFTDPKLWHSLLAERAAIKAKADSAAAEEQRKLEEANLAAKLATEKAEADAAAQKIADDHRMGFHCLSPWDGSHTEVVTMVSQAMREPDSFEHIETKMLPVDKDGNNTLFMSYRARNGFGGMNVATAVATIDNKTCKATLLSLE